MWRERSLGGWTISGRLWDDTSISHSWNKQNGCGVLLKGHCHFPGVPLPDIITSKSSWLVNVFLAFFFLSVLLWNLNCTFKVSFLMLYLWEITLVGLTQWKKIFVWSSCLMRIAQKIKKEKAQRWFFSDVKMAVKGSSNVLLVFFFF